ncbi:protein YLS9 [Tripterygium wilfordii]|uniref:Protein YLS9 n=1 Tax=Tripterygium wilfordii TaxID=458696 RepID=A0A7J7DF53_TRIWF|nr:uncharacterized protein At1g08160-like [Tripterygium wilfordii]XP_038705757.1 uncharacterized protein At1g08160-like [Tripterygium wilfordii]XP_038705758.1 uncharacterized protein At1g08160-like [Tripterygium wilfordii]XP_038705759.1 uncharacterized protein At1g08160-like [Tripterygium wilfordii]XP_038705761.1 uncharacterized protein At1g08160-like [Tripterygium wilfordii]KAF5744908.1 protein YLS9 [Tripterygium wilfordii]
MADPSRPVTGYPTANGYPAPPPGSVYPYQAPPPQNPSHAYYYNAPPPPDPRSAFFRRFCLIIVALTVIFATVLFIYWLIIRPTVPEFRVDSLSVSNFNVTSSSQTVTGSWYLRLQVYNTNRRMTVSYDDVRPSIFYETESLVETRIPPFQQGKKNQTFVDASFSATNSYVDRWVVDGISADRARGNVSFNVKVVAVVNFRTGAWRARARVLRVYCRDVPVGITASSRSGKLVGGARECRVGV